MQKPHPRCGLIMHRISLNWPLDAQSKPGFGRQVLHKNVYQKAPRIVNDDVWTFNTQSSSQCNLNLGNKDIGGND